MKLTSLASGSSGNCYLVQSEEGHNILIDCGLSAKSVQKYLADFGVEIASLSAVFLTHNHGDHLKGAGTISQRWGVPVYANLKTLEAARHHWEKIKRMQEQKAGILGSPDFTTTGSAFKYNVKPLATGGAVSFGNMEVSSFPVSHDAAETVCYTVKENGRQFTILTDLGCATEAIFEPLCNSDLIVMEANHDIGRLRQGRYPFSLKARILGDRGHLSNTQAAEILVKVIERSGPGHTVWLAHLSADNNHPEIARNDISKQLDMHDIKKFPLYIAMRDKPSLQWNGEPVPFQLQMF